MCFSYTCLQNYARVRFVLRKPPVLNVLWRHRKTIQTVGLIKASKYFLFVSIKPHIEGLKYTSGRHTQQWVDPVVKLRPTGIDHTLRYGMYAYNSKKELLFNIVYQRHRNQNNTIEGIAQCLWYSNPHKRTKLNAYTFPKSEEGKRRLWSTGSWLTPGQVPLWSQANPPSRTEKPGSSEPQEQPVSSKSQTWSIENGSSKQNYIPKNWITSIFR